MAGILSRDGRRRRVLNDEVLSASSAHTALRASDTQWTANEAAPRYSEAAGVENHPQVTDFVPRRFRTLAMIAVTGMASTAVLELLHAYARTIAGTLGPWGAAPIDMTAPGNLAAWLSAVLLLLAGATCLLIYSIRRHKIADYRGRYRVWRTAAAACLVVSLDSVAGLHRMLAATATYFTHWTALRSDAVWWLVLGAVPLGSIAVRALVDVRESRLAVSTLVLAVLAYVTSIASYVGWLRPTNPQFEPMVTAGAALVGHWLLLMATASYARFVVLDAQGLIRHHVPRQKARGGANRTALQEEAQRTVAPRLDRDPRKRDSDHDHSSAAVDKDRGPRTTTMKSFRQQMKTAKGSETEDQSQWVDGSEPDTRELDDDEAPGDRNRRLSKSERKRLRKLRSRDQAA